MLSASIRHEDLLSLVQTISGELSLVYQEPGISSEKISWKINSFLLL
jgi:hypothetical protein